MIEIADQKASLRGCRDHPTWAVFAQRVGDLYGAEHDTDALLRRLEALLVQGQRQRPAALTLVDAARQEQPGWPSAAGHTVYTFYVDHFSSDLAGLIGRLDYLQELGVRWLHPLPLLKARPGDSDGGFAVSDFRQVEPALGTMADLAALTEALRARGMGLLLDVVCNHTAMEHDWAVRARAGDQDYRDFYRVLDTPGQVQAWEAGLVDVFPDTAPGSFTFDPDMGGYVWTTFYPFQWDLNYANPAVFEEMLGVLIFLANQGVEGFRLDSTPFLWKREGTNCRNQPEAYAIVEAWRAALTIVAPGVVLLAEAIESLEDVLPFFGGEAPGCDLAYNNGVMTALWAALADGNAAIARTVMEAAAARPDHGAWLNYVRCHDDLIWNALAAYAPPEDLQRWSSFYDGRGFSGGRAFQTAAGGVPSTNGMTASLVGLGKAGVDQDLARARLKLLYAIIHGLDGWPLIYMGDEVALGNDEAYTDDPERRGDGRWLHRPDMDWAKTGRRADDATIEADIFSTLSGLAAKARRLNDLGIAGRARTVDVCEPSVLAVFRDEGERPFLMLANLSPDTVFVARPDGFDIAGTDILTDQAIIDRTVELGPYGQVWWIADA